MDAGPIPKALDRRQIVWTYTMLQTYRDVCPHQAYRKLIKRDIPFTETPELKWGRDSHDALELRLTGNKPLPEKMQHFEELARQYQGLPVQAESRLAVDRDWNPVDYFAKNVWGRGRADIAIIQGSTAYLGDWKTGQVREDPFELKVQAVLLAAKYSQIERFVGQYIWLREMRPGPLHDLSDLDATMDEIDRLVTMIAKDHAADDFEKRKGPLCGWCDVQDCENWRPRR